MVAIGVKWGLSGICLALSDVLNGFGRYLNAFRWI